ncbi:TauD/TfdA dioxygenase family protein [Aquiflexum gelatinilyticum]|uniref:TauD/TfdA dioxygenase family protein n=1 Tax=Aquiflexum gelatinilyticum TaxID=2961943 RepID=UPI0021674210|nr:TauD/TfdA family dioxygenase [Aquiflexum gelatinilyticum]MCS4432853.1 TauD/TfdA family dioxygenase [Aquiflexum gelatinilyticum]
MTKFRFSENNNGIGVTVHEADLSLGLTPSQILQIQELLNRYKVVIFKNQNLNDDQLSEFAFRFGPPFVPDKNFPVLGSQDSGNSIVIVGNQANEYSKSYLGHQEVLPHSDHQWLKCPSSASLLYALDIHLNSAPTVWFDMVQAYNMLDSEIKSIIEEINSITYNPFYRPFGSVSAKYVDRDIDIPPGDTFPHPLVRTHPLTKEKILYLNIAYELDFVGVPYKVGNELFSKLYDHIINLSYKYEHQWHNGDLVFWDNRSTIHYRPSFDSSIRRVLKRVTIAGEMPY